MHAQEKATGLVAKRRYSVDVPLQQTLYHPLPTSAFRSLLRRLKSKVVGELLLFFIRYLMLYRITLRPL